MRSDLLLNLIPSITGQFRELSIHDLEIIFVQIVVVLLLLQG